MNRDALRWTRGRKLVNDRAFRKLKQLGGVGQKYDENGRVKEVVDIVNDGDGNKVARWQTDQPERKLNPHKREILDSMESILEYETSGHHPNVKPTAVKRAKKRYKNFIESGRVMAGVND